MTMDIGKSELVYHGRRAQRADSRQRRKAILEATLRLIVKEGIRGIRHRAVAREANVPLAATTYYFKDLTDLISDSFTYFVEQGLEQTRQLQDDSFAAARNLSPEERASGNGRKLLIQQLTRFILTHVRAQAGDRDRRLIELAFRNEALRNEQLTRAIRMANHSTELLIQEFFQLLGLTDPQAAAQIVHGTILNLEYQIISGAVALDSPLLERTVTMMIKALIPATIPVAELERPA
ncbi:TetR/AcrR family transcriptional regulator [Microbulbifer thermotolerans]|uniref:TetR family transcriptional regulator n=1 Tax=Microbulbifer thermotolerans TaxID=252514 RepID=A0A143HJL5_MICTH|nr:TetR family transcriptional regulator [Microbulbifer thermotolerans]AMX01701.1 TetR family transcriptional regulator [Microbulbifer thermotolerans]MCX2779470.1 TetR family transcriptional regulator [Microbulbifer thermotolerans]MCX2784017.1 TetR family transcriptional regulator [Microbulbifer thermotolerans]MCX2793341.1 TetR family transcriptional regulator [Microbulbifer thermotolerans]MCX2801280.1 TetR family transcriptional regulator [Microbulbifer thermotolerans]